MTDQDLLVDGDWELSLLEGFTTALRGSADVHCRGWPDDDGDLNPAEGIRQTLRLASAAMVTILETDPDYPALMKILTLTRQVQLPSTDAVYHYARLHGRNIYRIRGNRGSAHLFQATVWSGTSSNLKNYHLISKVDNSSDPSLAPDREIDIVLSATPQDGHWMELPPGECEIFIRQYYGDWDSENPALLTIEREGALYPAPPISRTELTHRMAMIADYIGTQSAYYRQGVKTHLAADLTKLSILSLPEALQDNVYVSGYYRCAPDEAVILEVTPPEAFYWGFQLSTLQWEALDYHERQCSLNFHQAAIDSDGVLRIVISHQDPGAANWLDTSGRTLGLISGRYFKAGSAPIPTLKTVSFADLGAHLRDDRRRVSLAERQQIIQRRRSSAFRRLCSDQ